MIAAPGRVVNELEKQLQQQRARYAKLDGWIDQRYGDKPPKEKQRVRQLHAGAYEEAIAKTQRALEEARKATVAKPAPSDGQEIVDPHLAESQDRLARLAAAAANNSELPPESSSRGNTGSASNSEPQETQDTKCKHNESQGGDCIAKTVPRAKEPEPDLSDIWHWIPDPPDKISTQQFIGRVVQYMEHATECDDVPEYQRIFHFVRVLKAHTKLATLLPHQAVTEIRKYIRKHDEPSFMDDFINVEQFEIENIWNKTRFPPGMSPIPHAMAMADRKPLQLNDDGGSEKYVQFVSTAAWLQVTMGNRNILLPCHKLAPFFNVAPKTIMNWTHKAERDKLLKRVKRYTGKPERLADEFRFDVKRWKILQDRAEEGRYDEAEGAQVVECSN